MMMGIYKALKDVFYIESRILIHNMGWLILLVFIQIGVMVSQKYMVTAKDLVALDAIILYFIIVSAYAFMIWLSFVKLEGFIQVAGILCVVAVFTGNDEIMYLVTGLMAAGIIMFSIFAFIEGGKKNG